MGSILNKRGINAIPQRRTPLLEGTVFMWSQGNCSSKSQTQIPTDVDGLEHVISKGRPAQSQTGKHKKLQLPECLAKLKFQKEDMNK